MKKHPNIKIKLSFEPAYQLIYWSLFWLAFFVLVIVIHETMRVTLLSVTLLLLVIGIGYLGFGNSLTIDETFLQIVYLRGIKRTVYPLSEVEKIYFLKCREVGIAFISYDERTLIYMNLKNKLIFKQFLNEHYCMLVEEESVKENQIK